MMIVQSDKAPQAERLRRRIQALMRQLRRANPWPSAAYTCGGYFRIPINIGGQMHRMPLGFVGSVGCRWARAGGCTMCDYGGFEGEVPDTVLIEQATELLDQWGPGETEINLSSLGSFFDDQELSPAVRRGILHEVARREHLELLGVESRANDITQRKILEAKSILGPNRCLEIGMGMESRNSFIRNVCINKGLSLQNFEAAVRIIQKCGAHPVAHALFKPPFLTEEEAVLDAIETINYLDSLHVRRIVLMVCNVKRGTLVGELYEQGLYRPSWLWSVLEAVLAVSSSARKKLLIYGFECGIPMLAIGGNCEACTPRIINAIDQFNGTADETYLQDALAIPCTCKNKWRKEKNRINPLPLPDRIKSMLNLLDQTVLTSTDDRKIPGKKEIENDSFM